MKKIILFSLYLFTGWALKAQQSLPKKVSYDLVVKDTMANYTGKQRHAIAINGQIPGPTIEFTQGHTAVIRVHNQETTTAITAGEQALVLCIKLKEFEL